MSPYSPSRQLPTTCPGTDASDQTRTSWLPTVTPDRVIVTSRDAMRQFRPQRVSSPSTHSPWPAFDRRCSTRTASAARIGEDDGASRQTRLVTRELITDVARHVAEHGPQDRGDMGIAPRLPPS